MSSAYESLVQKENTYTDKKKKEDLCGPETITQHVNGLYIPPCSLEELRPLGDKQFYL